MLSDAEILALHRAIVEIPSVSGDEGALADYLQRFLGERGVAARRLGSSLLALAGEGPVLLFDTHLDTVPRGAGWSREPFRAESADGKVYGLGANDAKAAVAAMTAAFLELAREPLPFTLALALVEGEETRGEGTQRVLAELASEARPLLGALVGEPTGLDVAIAQKGLLLLELVAHGTACHAAHAAALGATNAALVLARDLVRLADLDLGTPHPELGPTTLQPTIVRAGEVHNAVPGEATAVLDVRTVPGETHREIAARIAAAVASEVRIRSERLQPRAIDPGSPLVRAALAARPAARLYGSPTLSDWARIEGPAIKCGPGASERSHTADEHVLETEILAGVKFYAAFARALAESTRRPAGG